MNLASIPRGTLLRWQASALKVTLNRSASEGTLTLACRSSSLTSPRSAQSSPSSVTFRCFGIAGGVEKLGVPPIDERAEGLSLSRNRGNMSAGKKSKVEAAGAGEGSGDDDVRASYKKLENIQEVLDDINYEAQAKVGKVWQKYHKLKNDAYNRRNAVAQSIPCFWMAILISHPTLADLISKYDEKILNYLVNLEVGSNDMDSGFCITLIFNPNPYFEDRTVVKEYSFDDNGNARIRSSQIRWKNGMNIADGGAEEKMGRKRATPEKSFFSWFSEPKREVIVEWNTNEIGWIIKEGIWTNPLKCFYKEDDLENSDEEAYIEDIDKDPDYEQEDDDQEEDDSEEDEEFDEEDEEDGEEECDEETDDEADDEDDD